MHIAIIGYGRMGHAVEQQAVSRGHVVVCRIDKDTPDQWTALITSHVDVAIDFSSPLSAEVNLQRATNAGVPVVSGTTGWDALSWLGRYPADCPAVLWSANFSLGVQLFLRLNEQFARLMSPLLQYRPSIEEVHHIHKVDKPSGTAKVLSSELARLGYTDIPISSVREGEIVGVHTVTWTSGQDLIRLTHEATTRDAFAFGAVIAAEWLVGKRGVHTFQEVLFNDKREIVD